MKWKSHDLNETYPLVQGTDHRCWSVSRSTPWVSWYTANKTHKLSQEFGTSISQSAVPARGYDRTGVVPVLWTQLRKSPKWEINKTELMHNKHRWEVSSLTHPAVCTGSWETMHPFRKVAYKLYAGKSPNALICHKALYAMITGSQTREQTTTIVLTCPTHFIVASYPLHPLQTCSLPL